jgi:lipoprotein-releasing system ATP-binding protein
MLEITDVYKHYDSPDQSEKVAVLKGINLSIGKGSSIAVVGPSGCGKSTLLNLMGALDRPTQGRIEFDGKDLGGLNATQLAGLRNQDIGFVFQLHHLLPQCTVLENVLVPTLAAKDRSSAGTVRARAEALLERVGLEDYLAYRPAQLSGGQRQRVAVARALINEPKLLLADEPTGSLDQDTAERIGALLLKMHQDEGVTLVVVTHAMNLAQQLDTVFNLDHGVLEPARNN